MMRVGPMAGVLVAAFLFGSVGAASAQGVTPEATVTEDQGETTVSPNDDGFDWGWFGLLGLLGLAGLRGRRRDERTDIDLNDRPRR